jgi:formate dehydrogenase maturation protein FdhE
VFYTLEDDGLVQPWKGRVWMNPPYSQVGAWMAKARAEVDAGNAELVVCLVPARVDARWYRAATGAASVVRVLPQRVKFGGCTDSAPFPSAVIVLGDDGKRHGAHPKRCAACKHYWFPVRSDARTCSEACKKRRQRVPANAR